MDPTTTEETTQKVIDPVEPQSEDKVLAGTAHTTDTPDWLKEASGDDEETNKIVEPVGKAPLESVPEASVKTAISKDIKGPLDEQFREKKPSAAELGDDPNSDVVVRPSMEVVDKVDKSAAEKMRKAGIDPLTGKQIEGAAALKEEQTKNVAKKKSLIENVRALFPAGKKKAVVAGTPGAVAAPNASVVGVAKKTGVTGMAEKEKQEIIKAEKIYQEGLASIKDLIAPASMEIQYDKLLIDGMWAQSFYVFSYPRYLDVNWLAPVVNFDVTMDISQFVYPINSGDIMRTLKKKVAQMQSSMRINAEKGQVRDPALETALEDADQLRTEIQRGQEKFFQFALYFTLYSDDKKKLEKSAKQLESLLAGKLVMTKRAQIQAEHAFNATLPLCLDELYTVRNMNTGPLSTTFPFTSSDLTSDKGILYGVNRHNDSLIIFDRFALENANSVVFAKSGAGKSYGVKLEILRLMMMGTDVIVIDPENEYEALSNTVGGSYLRLSLNSDRRINPFDLPKPVEGDDVKPGDLLRSAIINLHGLMKLMLGAINPEEESILDKALIDVYALKGITMEGLDPSIYEPPTMEDLHQVLSSMDGATSLVQRISKYTEGSYSGIFNKPTNVDLSTGMMVFCIRDLEDALRPIAMYIVLNYIWNRVRSELKKRVLVIDEAWSMMQHEDSAKFLFGLVKRARKYYLGVTTITQDVEDFVKCEYGKPIITNSSMQLLLKQAPSAVDMLAKIFNLTEGEKYVLLNSGVGQGLFFAGLKHVAVQIIASYTEDKIVTTDPEKILMARDDAVADDSAPEDAAPAATA
jgi:conjugal transfer ATP-binding protein TraC